jgi:GntR family transcriptional regulator of abcA and norABC
MRVDLLEGLLARRNIRLVVVQPTYHNPTGAVLAPARREQLLVLARRHGVPILEDDPYASLTLEGDDPGTLISRDRHSLVVRVGSFSKTLTPGFRLGWMSGPAPVLARLAVVKQFADLNSNLLGQAILAQMIESGSYHRHVERMIPLYRQRRDAVLHGLAGLGGRLTPTSIPRGGFHLWCRVEAGPLSRLLAAAAPQEGVAVVPGEAFHPVHSLRGETGAGHVRVSFSEVALASIPEGVRRLGRALDSLPDTRAAGGLGSRIVV